MTQDDKQLEESEKIIQEMFRQHAQDSGQSKAAKAEGAQKVKRSEKKTAPSKPVSKKERKPKPHRVKAPVSPQIMGYRILCAVLLLALLVVGFYFGRNYWIQDKADSKFEELSSFVNAIPQNSGVNTGDSAQETTDLGTVEYSTVSEAFFAGNGYAIPQKNLDWDMLHETNKDIYAWIYIPNTNIDYPILQSETDDSYYLHYNLDGSRGYPACIYTEMQNSKAFDDYNTLVYGHNMKNGTMFRNLHYFEDERFFEENPFIYIYTEEGRMVYEIFAAYERDDKHILNTNDFSSVEGYAAYLATLPTVNGEKTLVRNGIQLTTDNKLLTLSTCTTNDKRRYLVQAVLVDGSFPLVLPASWNAQTPEGDTQTEDLGTTEQENEENSTESAQQNEINAEDTPERDEADGQNPPADQAQQDELNQEEGQAQPDTTPNEESGKPSQDLVDWLLDRVDGKK